MALIRTCKIVLFLCLSRVFNSFARKDGLRLLGGHDSSPNKLGVQESLCDTVFTCPECLASKNCGWCETDGENPLCVSEADRAINCEGSKDNWIGQSPPGQQCPNTLFQGSTIEPKWENHADDIGGGGFASSGRKASTQEEIQAHLVAKLEEERIAKLKKSPATIGNCLEKAKLAHGNKVVGQRSSLVVGSWGHVPRGCSVQSKGDWAAHYNLGHGHDPTATYTPVL